MTERVIVTKRRIYRLAPEQEGVPVETYFPGAILPEMLKGATVYQTKTARLQSVRKDWQEFIKYFCDIILLILCFPRFLGEQYFTRRTEHKAAALPSHASKILTKLR